MSYLVDPFPGFIAASYIKTIFAIGSRDARDAVQLDDHYKPDRLFAFEPNPHCALRTRDIPQFKGKWDILDQAFSKVRGPAAKPLSKSASHTRI